MQNKKTQNVIRYRDRRCPGFRQHSAGGFGQFGAFIEGDASVGISLETARGAGSESV
jgi:hypothetical protein